MSDTSYFYMDDFLAHEYPNQTFLVDKVLPQGGYALFHGRGGLGKTQLALTLAHAVLREERWLGLFQCKQGKVCFIQLDMTPQLQQDRLRQTADALGMRYKRDMSIVPIGGSIDIMHIAARVGSQEVPEDLGWVSFVRAEQPRLIIVDSLRRSHRLDENKNDSPVAVYEAWREVVGPGPTLLFLHHDNKGGEQTGMLDGSRGASAWQDEVDLAVGLKAKNRHSKALDHMLWTKHRTFLPGHGDVPEKIHLTINPETLLVDVLERDPRKMWAKKQLEEGYTKAHIVKGLQDTGLFRDPKFPAVSQAQAYRIVDEVEKGMRK